MITEFGKWLNVVFVLFMAFSLILVSKAINRKEVAETFNGCSPDPDTFVWIEEGVFEDGCGNRYSMANRSVE